MRHSPPRHAMRLAAALALLLLLAVSSACAQTIVPQYLGAGRSTSSTSDSPTGADCGTTITYTAGTTVSVTLPTSGLPASTAEQPWCHIAMLQAGTGKVVPTISSAAPLNAHSCTGTSARYAFISVSTPDGGTTWLLSGDCS
jgi:hypothetical protein